MTQWDYQSAHAAALKCSSKGEFERSSGGACAWARRNGVLEDITSHMEKSILWDEQSAMAEAKKYNNRMTFQKGSSGCVKWLRRHNLLDKACEHMQPQFRWSCDAVTKEAKRFSSRNEFHQGNPSAAQWATKRGLMDSLFPHKLTFWDLDSVAEEALKYSSREEFRANATGAAHWAAKNGVWDSICAHMDHLNRPVTHEEAIAESVKYQTRSAFYHNSPRAYAWALRNACLDKICQHMEPGVTVSDADAIYIWSPVGLADVFKFGVSSVRLADRRIKIVAKAGGLDVDFYTIRRCRNARQLERQLLEMGRPYMWPQQFNGCTEFRRLDPNEIDVAFSLLRPHEELTA